MCDFIRYHFSLVLYGFLLMGVFSTFSLSQDGTLDTLFGIGGKVTTQIGPGYDAAYSVAIQSDGKIVVAGESYISGSPSNLNNDIALVRYNVNGSLDDSFGAGGIVTTPIGSGLDLSQGVLIQSDGRIIATGQGWDGAAYRFAAVRYNVNGSLDNSFGTGGIATTRLGVQGYGLSGILQADGKILVVGSSDNGSNLDFGVVRFNTNGTLDNSFGSGGKVTTAVGASSDFGRAGACQADGKIVVAGYYINNQSNRDFALVRYHTNGSLDNSFGSGGKVTTPVGLSDDRARSMALQSDEKIVVVGASFVGSNNNFAIVRYNSNGSLDNNFGVDGKVRIAVGNDVSTGEDGAFSVAIQADGKILAAGWALNPVSGYDFAVVRLMENGSLDSTFANGGIALTPIGTNDFGQAIALQADGKIVVAGASYDQSGDYAVAVVRYNNSAPTGITSALELPEQLMLSQNYPNPFNPSTEIRFTVAKTYRTTLEVYNLMGQKVMTLFDEVAQAGHEYHVRFTGSNLASGVYIYRLKSGPRSASRKLILLQ